MTSINFVDPEKVLDEFKSTQTLSVDQVTKWRKHGYLLLNNILSKELVNQAIDQLSLHFANDSYSKQKLDFGGMEFPCRENFTAVNDLMLSPELIKISSTLLNTNDIRLTQADAWAKYYSEESKSLYDNRDQRTHIDCWNHTLVCPDDFDNPVSVAMIIYLSDSTITGGETAVTCRIDDNDVVYNSENYLNTPGAGINPWINDRQTAEEWLSVHNSEAFEFREQIYEREVRARFQPGTVLIYRHDLWHRGTSLKEGSIRLVINLSYRRADCDWFQHWNTGWARHMYSPEQTLEKFIANASVDQRNVLGFPKPGHSYWNKKTLDLVRKRYQHLGFDATPYEQAISEVSKQNHLC